MQSIITRNNCNFRLTLAIITALSLGISTPSFSQTTDRPAPEVLPGKGLAQHDVFYAGEAKARNMYIIQKGKVTWSYIDTTGKGEISDAVLMANGNIIFAHQYGVTLINKDKKVLWHYDAPNGFETHTAQLIGTDHVVFVQNGNPAKVLVYNIKTNSLEKEFIIPFKSGTHGQIRHARLTAAGTLLIAHMDLGKVNEYDTDGKILSSVDVPSVWSAVLLKNGNLLVSTNQGIVKEITRSGNLVWDAGLKELPDYKITNPQVALRLPNGNTLINNWFNQWDKKLELTNPGVQAIEITPENKVIWALRSWELGPSTTIQLLKDPNNITQNVHFGDFK